MKGQNHNIQDARACITSRQRISYVTYKDAPACITSRQRISYVTTGNGNKGHEFNTSSTRFIPYSFVSIGVLRGEGQGGLGPP